MPFHIGIGLAEMVGLLLILWWGKGQGFFFGNGVRKKFRSLFLITHCRMKIVQEMAHAKSLFKIV